MIDLKGATDAVHDELSEINKFPVTQTNRARVTAMGRQGAVAHAGAPPLAKTAAGYRTTTPFTAVSHGRLL